MAEVTPLPAGDVTRLEGYADVLEVLIRLFDRELDQDYLTGFAAHDIAGWLADWLTRPGAVEAARALGEAVGSLPVPCPADQMDDMAAEYADLMLTHGYRVAPNGSVWLDEDHLERQMPMFDVREWYDHYDIKVPNWRVRADDHLVHLLQFLAFLCRAGTLASATDAARFMDAHVLSWVPEFCRLAEPNMQTKVYQAAIALVPETLEELRDALEQVSGAERRPRLAAPPKSSRTYEEDAPYMPGLAESW